MPSSVQLRSFGMGKKYVELTLKYFLPWTSEKIGCEEKSWWNDKYTAFPIIFFYIVKIYMSFNMIIFLSLFIFSSLHYLSSYFLFVSKQKCHMGILLTIPIFVWHLTRSDQASSACNAHLFLANQNDFWVWPG